MYTPILLITFNRPWHTQQVLSAIMAQDLSDLYVFQDGPREGNLADVEKTAEVKNIIESMTSDTSVQVHTFFSEINLGCGPGPAAGISWFFENVDKGIIIEDDAVPHPDFFKYAEELLEKYKDDNDVRAIGSMHLDDRTYGDGSYYFSKMNRTFCAWATWKRAWNDFDLNLRSTSRADLNNALRIYGARLREREYWCDRLDEIHKDCYHNSSWDQQFWMSIWLHHGKGIMPNANLSSNIGFDEEATHTTDSNSPASQRKTESILPLVHPTDSSTHRNADLRFQKIYFAPFEYGVIGLKRLPYRLNKRLKRLLHHEGPWLKKCH